MIFADERFADALHKALLPVPVLQFDRLPNDFAQDETIAATLPYLAKVKEDLAYLSGPEPLHLSGVLDFSCSIAAQNVMRAFAWRLPDFHGAACHISTETFLIFREQWKLSESVT